MIHKTIKIANIGSIFNFTINQMLVKKLNKIAEAMVGITKFFLDIINIAISISVILGTFLGPEIYLFSTEWSLLFAGLIAGTVAYLIGEKDGK